ncbi:MAG: hypothetical protein IJX18_02415 [Clostridia bacterium]|nr:hypothetical protein [Clostridia bacterium]
MTDFHTHVLPRLDDGASSVEVASQMLLSAHKQGVTTVVASSHYYGKNRSPEQFLEERNNSYELLKEHIPAGMRVKLGAEVYVSERLPINVESLKTLCVEGTRYLLIELPFVKKWERSIYEKISDIFEHDCIPVLAHVDRYAAFIDKPQRLLDFINMGCLLQVNASAFWQKPVQNFAFTLLKKGYVHAIGTDMHDCAARGSDMAKARESVIAQGLQTEWDVAQKNMQKMLADEMLEINKQQQIKKFFLKFL